MFCGSRGLKSRLAKAAGAEPSGEMRDEKLHAAGRREAHFEGKTMKKRSKHTNTGAFLEDEMLKKCTPLWREAHFVVKMHKTPVSEHFWKLRC